MTWSWLSLRLCFLGTATTTSHTTSCILFQNKNCFYLIFAVVINFTQLLFFFSVLFKEHWVIASFKVLLMMFSALCYCRFKKNLKAFYFVHPTFRSKVRQCLVVIKVVLRSVGDILFIYWLITHFTDFNWICNCMF